MPERNEHHTFKLDEILCQEIYEHSMLVKDPIVSVKMITFNHEKYIAQAIEGVLMQKTDFSFELVIGEDCSTDRTREIVIDYQKKHPNIIRVIAWNTNVGMKKNGQRTAKDCRGKYMAICEGDDYWTDPYKLQKQSDFMTKNPDCTICFHAAEHDYENNPKKNFIHGPQHIKKNRFFSIKHAIVKGGGFITTASMFFKAEHVKNLPFWFFKAPVGDIPLMLILASKGRIGYLDDVMCVCRRFVPDSWSSKFRADNSKMHLYDSSKMYDDFNRWTNNKYFIYVQIRKIMNIMRYYKKLLKFFLLKKDLINSNS